MNSTRPVIRESARVHRFLLSVLAVVILALPGAIPGAHAQSPKRGGTLQFAISAETPHYDSHGSDTFATVHFAAPFYSTLLKFNLDEYPQVIGDLADSWTVAP